MTPCVLAGPTCDCADVLYEKMPYPLPVTLEIGDKLLIEGTGRLYVDLLVGGLQRHPAAEDLPHLTRLASEARLTGSRSAGSLPSTLPDLTTLPAARSRRWPQGLTCHDCSAQDQTRPHPESRSVRDPCGEGFGRRRPRSAARCLLWREPPSCAPASACATDARPPKALPSRRWREGRLVGTLRLWHVSAGGCPGARARPARGGWPPPASSGSGPR